MCSTENKETRLGKTPGPVRTTDKGRQNKREQKNTKPKKEAQRLAQGQKGGLKGFIICEFASCWTIGRKFANYEQGEKEGKQRRTRIRKEMMVLQTGYYKCTRVHYIYTRKKGNKRRHFLLLVHTIFVPLHNGKKSGQKASSKNRHLKHGINIPYDRREKKARQD